MDLDPYQIILPPLHKPPLTLVSTYWITFQPGSLLRNITLTLPDSLHKSHGFFPSGIAFKTFKRLYSCDSEPRYIDTDKHPNPDPDPANK